MKPHPASSNPAVSTTQNMSGRKLKLLCLHSFRTSGSIFREQFARSGLDEALKDLVDLDFINAPIPALGPAMEDVQPNFKPPFFQWWIAEKGADGEWEYFKSQEAINYVEHHIRAQGPYDGLVGFSQGTAVASVFAGLHHAGLIMQDVPAFKCVVLFAGFKSRSPQHAPAFASPILTPSIHIIGEKDFLKEASEELTHAFHDPVVLWHRRGHVVPRLDATQVDTLRSFLSQAIAIPAVSSKL